MSTKGLLYSFEDKENSISKDIRREREKYVCISKIYAYVLCHFHKRASKLTRHHSNTFRLNVPAFPG